MTQAFFDRWAVVILLVSLLAFPVPLIASIAGINKLHNRVDDWLPRDVEETRDYLWFVEHFRGDEVLIATWPGCTLDDARLDQLVERAGALKDEHGEPLFRRIVSGRSVLARLTSNPINLSRDDAIARMRDWLVGPDNRTTSAIFMVDTRRSPDRAIAMTRIREAAAGECRIPIEELKLGGPTADSVHIDEASMASLKTLAICSVLFGVLLAWFFLKDVRLVLAVFLTAVQCELWSLGLPYFAGASVDAVLIMMPSLIYILAICGCIHLLNCYQEVLATVDPSQAPARALGLAWKPTFTAALTTSLGMLSLCVSELAPVRKFGFFSAIGVFLSVAFFFLFLPAFLTRFGRRGRPPDAPFENGEILRLDVLMARLAIRHSTSVLVALTLMMAVLAVGAMRTRSSARIRDMFSERSRAMTDYRWIETHVGPIIPIDIVLGFTESSALTMLERLEMVDRAGKVVEQTPHVEGVSSAVTFLPPIPRTYGLSGTGRRVVMNRLLSKRRDDLLAGGYLAEAAGQELWLVSARVAAFDDIEYSQLLSALESDVSSAIQANLDENSHQVTITVCGGIPLINSMQQQLMTDMVASFGAAILLIGISLAIALRSILAASLLLIPNVFPIAVIFGLMGWLGITIDLGAMMTVSAALGISVDNELHFVAWHRRLVVSGVEWREALVQTFRHCGGPMVQTAFICGLGMLVFSASDFVPTSRFGTIMCTLIWTAVIGDLLLLPAILASRAARFFAPPAPIAARKL